MKHFLSTTLLSTNEIISLLDRAENFSKFGSRELPGKYIVSNLFFEPSTRTKMSFEVAERKLGLDVIPFESGFSSTLKGETLYDTVKTFEAIGVDILVIRHSEEGYYEEFIEKTGVSIINGGDGSGQHPTQSMLDLLTIRQEFGTFQNLNIVIAGDIAHSRVAKSNADTLMRLGANVTFLCPAEWTGDFEAVHEWNDEMLQSDVVMLLRVQHERHDGKFAFTKEDYHEKYGLTVERANRMKEKSIIMHPAPFNRGVEIAEELIESKRSRIFKQMENGVYVRMAILEAILSGRN